jgi:hypothetical protein
MVRFLLGGFVVAHGFVTAMIWTAPANEDAPFRVTHSWLLGDVRALGVALALVAAFGFVLQASDISPTRAGGACSRSGQERSR